MNGLYALKPWYARRLSSIATLAVRKQVSPDVFTALGLLAALFAGASIAFSLWPLAALFLALRLAGANLDGSVARAQHREQPWGFVLNELGDRLSDLAAFAGLALLALRVGTGLDLTLALLAALAASLPTLASLMGAAAGATRRNGGPLGKTERCLLLVLATTFHPLLPWVCALVLVLSPLTALLRLRSIHAEISGGAA